MWKSAKANINKHATVNSSNQFSLFGCELQTVAAKKTIQHAHTTGFCRSARIELPFVKLGPSPLNGDPIDGWRTSAALGWFKRKYKDEQTRFRMEQP